MLPDTEAIPEFYRNLAMDYERKSGMNKNEILEFFYEVDRAVDGKFYSLHNMHEKIFLAFNLTLRDFCGLMCWVRVNKSFIDAIWGERMAMEHCETFGEDAAFVAACICHENRSSSNESKEVMAAKAYMKIFSEECNSWYAYNDSMDDPIVPKSIERCGCLPRCYKKCVCPMKTVSQIVKQQPKKETRDNRRSTRHVNTTSGAAVYADTSSENDMITIDSLIYGPENESESIPGSEPDLQPEPVPELEPVPKPDSVEMLLAARSPVAGGGAKNPHRGICQHYHRSGSCKYGARCKFQHVLPSSTPQIQWPPNPETLILPSTLSNSTILPQPGNKTRAKKKTRASPNQSASK